MRHLTLITSAGLAIAVIALAGCSGDDDGDSETTVSEPPVAAGTADRRVVKRIPFDSSPDQVVAQIGRPARSEREKAGKYLRTCYFYRVLGGPPTAEIKMCFDKDELDSVLVINLNR